MILQFPSDSPPSPEGRRTATPASPPTTRTSPTSPEPRLRVGSFVWRPFSDRWRWSTELFWLFGFDPGTVTPTAGMILAHVRAEDRPTLEEAFRTTAARPDVSTAVSVQLNPTRGQVRTLVWTLHHVGPVTEAAVDASPAGGRGVVVGSVTDLNPAVRVRVRTAVEDYVESVASIEQAKGLIAGICGVPVDDAATVLAWYSRHYGVKTAALASALLTHDSGPESTPRTRAALETLLADTGRRLANRPPLASSDDASDDPPASGHPD